MSLKEQIQSKMNDLRKEYEVVGTRVDESNDIIKELDDRKLRQREARNIYLARATQIEDEYRKLSEQLNELNSTEQETHDDSQNIVIPPRVTKKSSDKR